MAQQTPAKKTTPAMAQAPAKKAPPTPEDEAAAAERARVEQAEAEEKAARDRLAAEEQARADGAKGRAELRREAETKEEKAYAAQACVVSDGTQHMGRALPGKKICSAHEMHYLPDGTPRVKAHAEQQKAAQQPQGGTLVEGA